MGCRALQLLKCPKSHVTSTAKALILYGKSMTCGSPPALSMSCEGGRIPPSDPGPILLSEQPGRHLARVTLL